MANIPVEKKSSSAWIWILLALLVVALLIWWLVSEVDEGDEADIANDVETVQTTGTEGVEDGRITSLDELGDLEAMIGRDVYLEDVAVTEVVGDMAFTIGEGDDEILVTFNQVPTPDTPTEGEIDVNPGSRVTIEGAVQSYDGNVATSVSEEIADDTAAFIDAATVTVMN
ncbi:MAG: hypothetical protein WA985_11310 [Erythrobacter sp.]|uniref:hypothetical protein n=1 Tax=Erythrobacter sp. TaxID=1042 RepID=UPI003C7616BC